MAASSFRPICLLHSAIYLIFGSLLMFYPREISGIGHGTETAKMLLGSTPHDQLLIATAEAFVGMLLVVIGILLFMVSFVQDRDFQIFFARGCIFVHFLVVVWRFSFERKVAALARDWPRQVVGDFILSLSWAFFLLYTWREKYD